MTASSRDKSFPTNGDVEHVIAEVRPQRMHKAQCRTHVIRSLQGIRDYDFVPNGSVKKKLERTAKAVKKARIALANLPIGQSLRLFTNGKAMEDFLLELRRVGKESEALADETRVDRSGGDVASRVRRRMAAEDAFDMLNDWGGRVPTLSKRGDYVRLAGLLFERATGRAPGDMERACREFIQALVADGFPNAKERQRLKRSGKLAAKQAPKWMRFCA